MGLLAVCLAFALPALVGPAVSAAATSSRSTLHLSGVVTDVHGAPVPNVHVTVVASCGVRNFDLEEWGTDQNITTDAQGKFSGVTCGPTTLYFYTSDVSFADAYLGGTANLWAARLITSSAKLTGIHMTLPPAGSISGHLTLPSGVPHSPRVTLLSGDAAGQWRWAFAQYNLSTTSTADGFDYSYTQLPPGQYAVGASTASQGSQGGEVRTVTVSAGQDVTGADVSMAPLHNHQIQGTVTLPNSQPAVGSEVYLASQPGATRFRSIATVAADGSFTATRNLNPGTYRLMAEPDSGPSVASRVVSFTVTAGSDPAPIDMALRTGATVSGTVTTPVGKPAAHFEVELGDWDMTDSQGRFTAHRVLPGKTSLRLQDGYDPSYALLATSANPITVAPGEHVSGLHLKLKPVLAEISGKNADQAYIYRVVNGKTQSRPMMYTRVQPPDRFKAYVPPGSYRVHFDDFRYCGEQASARLCGWFGTNGTSATSPIIHLKAGQRRMDINGQAHSRPELVGSVDYAGGGRIASGMVSVYEAGTHVRVEHLPLEGGRYWVDGLPPGKYQVQFTINRAPLKTSATLGENWWPSAPPLVSWYGGSTRSSANVISVGTRNIKLRNVSLPMPPSTF